MDTIHATEAEAEFMTEEELALELQVSEQIKASEEMAQYTAFDEDDEDDEG